MVAAQTDRAPSRRRLIVLLHDSANDGTTFSRQCVKFLAHLDEPAPPGQSLDTHDAAQDLVRIGILVGVPFQAKGAWELLPRGDNQSFGAERRLALLFELV